MFYSIWQYSYIAYKLDGLYGEQDGALLPIFAVKEMAYVVSMGFNVHGL